MNTLVNINGRAVDRIIYKDKPVITLRMIDELHERHAGTAGAAFRRNKKRLIEQEDYFVVPKEEWEALDDVASLIRRETPSQKGGYRGDLVFLTETGYLILVKVFDDDLAWRIQRQLVNLYFKVKAAGFPDEAGLLPRPGLSMAAVPPLCRQASKGCRFSAKALSHFYGMPVDDLVDEVIEADPDTSETAGVIAQYFGVMLRQEYAGIKIDGDSITATSRALYNACLDISRGHGLPKFFDNVKVFGVRIAREHLALESLGWRREIVTKMAGERVYRITRIAH